jgi:hypothetical protein
MLIFQSDHDFRMIRIKIDTIKLNLLKGMLILQLNQEF